MKLQEKLRKVQQKLKEMYIEGSDDLLKTKKSNNPRYESAYDEAIFISKQLSKMASGEIKKNCIEFDKMNVILKYQ